MAAVEAVVADGIGCKRWDGGCVVAAAAITTREDAIDDVDSSTCLTGLTSGDSENLGYCWLFEFMCNEVRISAAFIMVAGLFGEGKLPGAPPVDGAEISPPPLWSSLPQS